MKNMLIRDAVETDFRGIVHLNDHEVKQTSPMDIKKLRRLDGMAAYHKIAAVDGKVAAFLLAVRDGEPYENDNYQWFASRYKQFLYIDRVVVGSGFSGQGIGGKLYADLFEYVRLHNIPTVVCEYNIEPPNPASHAFHEKLGFKEVGRQYVADGTKLVSMQAREAR